MRRDVFVYLSGPITPKHGFSIEENVTEGLKTFLQLTAQGIPSFCPQLTGAFPSAWTEVSWEQWMDYDYAIIDRCTHMLMLPRWSTSTGAMQEMEYAQDKQMPIFYFIDDLIQHIGASR